MADAIKKGAEAVKDKVSGQCTDGEGELGSTRVLRSVEVASGASFEAHKAAAKDSDRSIGDRVSHGEYSHGRFDITSALFYSIRCRCRERQGR